MIKYYSGKICENLSDKRITHIILEFIDSQSEIDFKKKYLNICPQIKFVSKDWIKECIKRKEVQIIN